MVETSNGNYQIWLRFNQRYNNEVRKAIIKYFGADKACTPKNRWGRCPNFLNVKDKHFNNDTGTYFYANIQNVSSFANNVENGLTYELSDRLDAFVEAELQSTKERIAKSITSNKSILFDSDGVVQNVKIRKNVYREMYRSGNKSESEIDFSYALALKNQGYSDNEIANRILEERSDWTNHPEPTDYLKRTLFKVRQIQ